MFIGLSTAISNVLGTADFNPATLFDTGAQGWVYDLNDFSTMFQDAAGTVPAAVNQPVGLVLDKSKRLVLGADSRSAGAIGLTGVATAATYNSGTGVGSVTRVDASNQSFVTFTGLSANTFYRLTFSAISGTLAIRSGGVTGTAFGTIAAAGTALCQSNASGVLTITANGAETATFTLSAITSIAGNHKYQTTAASRSILRGTPTGENLFTAYGTPGAGWVNSGGGVATGTATNSGIPTTTAAVIGRVYRVRYKATVTAGSVQPTFGGVSLTSRSASGTYEQYITATSTAVLNFNGTGFTGTVSAIDCRDASADAVTAPHGLQKDGVDDFELTAPVDLSGTDKMTVCMGVRKLSDAAAGMAVELSVNTNTNNGAFFIAAPDAAGTFYFASKGTVNVVVSRSTFTAPISAVLVLTSNIVAPTLDTRVNGVASATSTSSQGTGNFGNYALYFGRRGGANVPMNGLEFSSIGYGGLAVTAQLANIERWVTQRTPL